MKKILLFTLLVALCSPAFAWEDKQDSLEIAYEFSDYGYREPHMEYPIHISGKKHGVSFAYTRRHVFSSFNSVEEDPSFARLEALYMNGKVDYDGYLQDGTPFENYDEKDWYVDVDLKLGRVYTLDETLSAWPYIGIGYRTLRNGEDGIKDFNGTPGYVYQRTSTYVYVPIGASFVWTPTEETRLTLSGEFDWLLHGNQNSHLPASADVSSVSNAQDKGFGVRASAKFEVGFGAFSVFAEPFYRYWKIQNSDVVAYFDYSAMQWYGAQEPFNITREYGVRVGVAF